MSCEAKLWTDEGWLWFGVNDHQIEEQCYSSLHEAIESTEEAFENKHMRWIPFEFKNGLGLKGYIC